MKTDGDMFKKDREKSEWKVWNNFSISEKHTFNSILIREEREFTGEYDHVNIKNDREMALERESDEYSLYSEKYALSGSEYSEQAPSFPRGADGPRGATCRLTAPAACRPIKIRNGA